MTFRIKYSTIDVSKRKIRIKVKVVEAQDIDKAINKVLPEAIGILSID